MKNLKAFKAMLKGKNWVVLDTETTGLYQGEVVQIGVVDAQGKALLDTLVKPVKPIPPEAMAIHGITNEMVLNAPSFAEIHPQLLPLLKGTNVVVYNASYDRKMLHQSAEACGLEHTDWKTLGTWWCAMEAFAHIYGNWNNYHRSYRWQKLSTACEFYNLSIEKAHSALADALATYQLCREMMK